MFYILFKVNTNIIFTNNKIIFHIIFKSCHIMQNMLHFILYSNRCHIIFKTEIDRYIDILCKNKKKCFVLVIFVYELIK